MKINKLIVLAVFLPVLVFGVVGAQSDSPTDPTENLTAAEIQQKINERLQLRKAQNQTRLDEAEKTSLRARCQAAQNVLDNVAKRVEQAGTSRTTLYKGLIERLNKLSTTLQSNNVDTAGLDGQITELDAKLSGFKATYNAYLQAVVDLANVTDCGNDPDAFKATLESARTELKNLRQVAKDLKTYLKDVIKPSLVDVRQQINSSAQE